jgi:PAS domain S-box-containing protein
MTDHDDAKFIQLAFDQALKSYLEGGLPIGAVMIENGEVVAAGHNRRVQDGDPTAHGEMDCLRRAGRRSRYEGVTLYTTLSPCMMCTGTILQFGIRTVVIGENQNFPGNIDILHERGVEVRVLDHPECVELMARFIRERPDLWDEDIAGRQTAESGHAITGGERSRVAPAPAGEPFRSAFDASPTGMLMVDPGGKIVMANRQVERIFGYTADEIVGQSVEVLLPSHHRHGHVRYRRAFAAEPAARHLGAGRDLHGRRKDGSEIPVEVGLNPVKRAGDTFVLASIIDITERKQFESALRASEQRLRTLFETVNLIVLVLDADGKVEYVNPYFLNLTGYTLEEAVGSDWFTRFVPAAERPQTLGTFRALLEHEFHPHYQNSIVTKAGKERTISWHNTVLRDAQNRPTGSLSVGEDITERAQLEAQLFQSQKMEAIGRLAGGIAHDFNNLLTVILATTEMLLADLLPTDPRYADLGEVKAAGERAASLTRQLLAFSRQQILEPRVVDLNALVTNLERMLRRIIGEDIRLHTAAEADTATVRADPGQLEQVILNLAVNSRDAMPDGGMLNIATANAELAEGYAEGQIAVKAGHYVLLAVHDTGAGMDAATRAQIFDPFFTTKPKGKGTGLGLATVYGIVKQSGGYIFAYSEPGQGSTFKIYLPRVDELVPQSVTNRPQSVSTGAETLLVVEDDEVVRNLTRKMLEARGYRVLTAAGGREALQLAARHPEPLPLLITDVIMPDMSGPELAERLTKLRPEMQVIYVSGYTGETIMHHGVLEHGIHFLQKPFTAEALALKVRHLLDRQLDD